MLEEEKRFNNFTQAYMHLLDDVYNSPEFECAPRGMKVKESLGVRFVITNPRDRIPYVKDRKFSISYMIAELLWYLKGYDSTEWIANYAAFWNNISDDGATANSAYGSRIFKPHKRIASDVDKNWCQWDYIIDELKRDPDSRRAVVHIRSPQDSILAKLDVPCTLTLQFFLRDDNVHLVVSMRSSDLILGLAYDVPAFTMFQELLAHDLSNELGREIGLGTYTHISNSLHIYERHFEMVERIVQNKDNWTRDPLPMPPLPIKNIRLDLEALSKRESLIRALRSAEELSLAHETFIRNSMLDPYFDDWFHILSSHRAGKLDDELLKEQLMRETKFEGYRFFKK